MKIGDLLKQAHAMQAQLSEAQETLEAASVTGESGAGLVKVTLNGRFEALRVDIDPTLVGDDRAMLEDLVAAAVNDAVHRVEAMQKESMGAMARRLGLPPGMKLPI